MYFAASERRGERCKPSVTKSHKWRSKWKWVRDPLAFDLSLSGSIPGDSRGKEHTCQCRRCRRRGLDPWVRKISWRRKCNPLQYFCLENPMDRGAWRAIVHADTKSWTQLSVLTHTHTHTHTHHSSKGLSPNHWSPRGLSGQVYCFPGSLPWSPYVLLLTQVLHIQAWPPPNASQHIALCSWLPPWSSPTPSAFRRLRGDWVFWKAACLEMLLLSSCVGIWLHRHGTLGWKWLLFTFRTSIHQCPAHFMPPRLSPGSPLIFCVLTSQKDKSCRISIH